MNRYIDNNDLENIGLVNMFISGPDTYFSDIENMTLKQVVEAQMESNEGD